MAYPTTDSFYNTSAKACELAIKKFSEADPDCDDYCVDDVNVISVFFERVIRCGTLAFEGVDPATENELLLAELNKYAADKDMRFGAKSIVHQDLPLLAKIQFARYYHVWTLLNPTFCFSVRVGVSILHSVDDLYADRKITQFERTVLLTYLWAAIVDTSGMLFRNESACHVLKALFEFHSQQRSIAGGRVIPTKANKDSYESIAERDMAMRRIVMGHVLSSDGTIIDTTTGGPTFADVLRAAAPVRSISGWYEGTWSNSYISEYAALECNEPTTDLDELVRTAVVLPNIPVWAPHISKNLIRMQYEFAKRHYAGTKYETCALIEAMRTPTKTMPNGYELNHLIDLVVVKRNTWCIKTFFKFIYGNAKTPNGMWCLAKEPGFALRNKKLAKAFLYYVPKKPSNKRIRTNDGSDSSTEPAAKSVCIDLTGEN